MIFVTVGHQTPFDRLIETLDEWAARHSDQQLFAQIGDGEYQPVSMPYTRWLGAADFERKLRECEGVIAHAGTGTIIQVLELGKPLLVLPRQAALGETRNDHQVGTAEHFANESLVLRARTEHELPEMIDKLRTWKPARRASSIAEPQLLARISSVIAGR